LTMFKSLSSFLRCGVRWLHNIRMRLRSYQSLLLMGCS
jgi:hypothetical protein